MRDLNDKIAALAFDPSATEGEAIAAFLKLRARKVSANDVSKHSEPPPPPQPKKTHWKNPYSTDAVKVRISASKLSDFLTRLHLNTLFAVNHSKFRVGVETENPGSTDTWIVIVETDHPDPFSMSLLRDLIREVVSGMNRTGRASARQREYDRYEQEGYDPFKTDYFKNKKESTYKKYGYDKTDFKESDLDELFRRMFGKDNPF